MHIGKIFTPTLICLDMSIKYRYIQTMDFTLNTKMLRSLYFRGLYYGKRKHI